MESNTFRQIKSRPHIHQCYDNRRLRSSGGQTRQNSSTNELPNRAVKILAKSNTSQQEQAAVNKIESGSVKESNAEKNENANTASNRSIRHLCINSLSLLNKHLQLQSTAHTENFQSLQRKSVKILDGEFNFLQDMSMLDIMLLGDNSNQSATTSANTTGQANTGNTSSGGQSFSIVSVVGLEGVGKSSVLNKVANTDIFKTHQCANSENPFGHVTSGIDLHITSERVFLLDSQPLLSASILDEFMRNGANVTNGLSMSSNHKPPHHHHYQHHNCSHQPTWSNVVGFEITETENFAFIYSLQMLTFLITISDHLVLVIDSLDLDAYLIKLLATALMMVGDPTVPNTNIIVYCKPQSSCDEWQQRFKQSFTALLGHGRVSMEFIFGDESKLISTVLKPPSRNLLTDLQNWSINYNSERAWFHSAQRYWDNSIRKSTLFSDYARYLP